MSRSYRKFPIIVDEHRRKTFYKRVANKKIRALKSGKIEELTDGGMFKKVYCSWIICDFKIHVTEKSHLIEEKFHSSTVFTVPGHTDEEINRLWFKRFKGK